MQSAPPVSVCGTGGRDWLLVQASLYTAASASLVGWVLGWTDLAAPWMLLAIAVPAAVGAGWFWRERSAGGATLLAWDGRGWQVDDVAGRLDVMVDLDRWLLLRFEPAGGTGVCWPAIGAAEVGSGWHGLRTAVHARQPLAETETASIATADLTAR